MDVMLQVLIMWAVLIGLSYLVDKWLGTPVIKKKRHHDRNDE